MPEKIINWQSTSSNCTFTIQGTADLGMQFENKEEPAKIVVRDYGKVPFGFTIDMVLNEIQENETEVQFILNANMSPILEMMAKKPLQNFLNILIDNLEPEIES